MDYKKEDNILNDINNYPLNIESDKKEENDPEQICFFQIVLDNHKDNKPQQEKSNLELHNNKDENNTNINNENNKLTIVIDKANNIKIIIK